MSKKAILPLFLSVFCLIGCAYQAPAPIKDHLTGQVTTPRRYTVHKGDTLYAIAWRYGEDYRDIAHYNHLRPPYPLVVGKSLWLVSPNHAAKKSARATISSKPSHRASTKKVISEKSKRTTAATHAKTKSNVKRKTNTTLKSHHKKQVAKTPRFLWPAKGRVIARYAPPRYKGINIGGKRGEKIRAAASGQVVYAGDGLRGYGHLIIVRHNANFLTAYGHNSKILVKEAQVVKAGQTIARMGDSGTNKIMLHFEIRRNGKPVNPLRYLRKG